MQNGKGSLLDFKKRDFAYVCNWVQGSVSQRTDTSTRTTSQWIVCEVSWHINFLLSSLVLSRSRLGRAVGLTSLDVFSICTWFRIVNPLLSHRIIVSVRPDMPLQWKDPHLCTCDHHRHPFSASPKHTMLSIYPLIIPILKWSTSRTIKKWSTSRTSWYDGYNLLHPRPPHRSSFEVSFVRPWRERTSRHFSI